MSLLFTIEGLDGTGKTTLAKALGKAIAKEFCTWVYVTKEPGLETQLGDLKFNRPGVDFRAIVLNDGSLTAFERELLFYADASQHRRFIENQKEAIVVSDRGLWSHLAYARASMKTKQLTYDSYYLCKEVIQSVCKIPNQIIYLKGSLELMKERNRDKTKDVIESNGDSFFSYVLETYKDLAFEARNCLILDASLPTSQNVEAVLSFLKEAYTDEQLRSGSE